MAFYDDRSLVITTPGTLFTINIAAILIMAYYLSSRMNEYMYI